MENMKLFTNYLATKCDSTYIVQTDGKDLYVNIYNDNGAGRHIISKKVSENDRDNYNIKREATKSEVREYSILKDEFDIYKSTHKGVNL